MNSLFTTFDFNTLFSTQMNWLGVFFFFFFSSGYWLMNGRCISLMMFFMNIFHYEMMVIFKVKNFWGQSLFFLSIFIYIFFMNFLGLFPYIFTVSSHLVLAFFMSIPLWLGSQMYSWYNFTDEMFCHLVPEGTPFLLMPLLVLIETVSSVIRPLTLAVRLVANMTAGHLLLVLLGSSGSLDMMMISFIIVFLLLFLICLELGVSLIQAYVFMLLMSLYISEVDYYS